MFTIIQFSKAKEKSSELTVYATSVTGHIMPEFTNFYFQKLWHVLHKAAKALETEPTSLKILLKTTWSHTVTLRSEGAERGH